MGHREGQWRSGLQVTGCAPPPTHTHWDLDSWLPSEHAPSGSPSPALPHASEAGTGDDTFGTPPMPPGHWSPGGQASGCWVDLAGKPWSPHSLFQEGFPPMPPIPVTGPAPTHEWGDAPSDGAPSTQSSAHLLEQKSLDLSRTMTRT